MLSAKYKGEITRKVRSYFADRVLKLLKEYRSKDYDEIWKMEDLNEAYFAKTKARLARMFRTVRGLKLPHKGE